MPQSPSNIISFKAHAAIKSLQERADQGHRVWQSMVEAKLTEAFNLVESTDFKSAVVSFETHKALQLLREMSEQEPEVFARVAGEHPLAAAII